MKYVVIEKDGMELAIILPDQVQHAEAVNRNLVKVVGAGFLRELGDGSVVCFGESASLGVSARAADLDAVVMSLRLMMKQAEDWSGKREGGKAGGESQISDFKFQNGGTGKFQNGGTGRMERIV